MAEKVTTMVLKVDLQCSKCYKKVKKILCQFPQIRDQKFDEKSNSVRITVVCCNPEKIRDKLCCKGGGTIKSIDIIEPKIDESKTKTKQKTDESKTNAKEKTDDGAVPPPPPDDSTKQKETIEKKGFVPAPPPIVYPAYYCLPYYYWPWHQPPPCHCGCGGRSRCHQPPPCHCGCGGRSGFDAYGRGYCLNRCDYLSEGNPSACSVM